jgi:transposase
MFQYSRYVGLDVHKETIVVGLAENNGKDPIFFREIPNKTQEISKLVKKLSPHGEVVSFCYEAGPCGYGIYRQITDLGHECMVVAPSLIPQRAGDRVKTDRRDCKSLARQLRAGELTAVWVPGEEQEAVRDLTRAREDMKAMERHSRQRLSAFLLRHNKVYSGKSKWTQAHFRWLERIKFNSPIQQIVFQEYVDTVKQCQDRVAAIEHEMKSALEGWSLAPLVQAIMAMRGFQLVSAMTVIAEIGNFARFKSPRQLMAFLGLVPSEHSSGSKRRRGSITKTGNGHVRRILVESAWSYQFPARKTALLQRRAESCSEAVQRIAWEGQKRLCKRHRHLQKRNKLSVKITVAVARELCGFIWAIAREVMGSQWRSEPV